LGGRNDEIPTGIVVTPTGRAVVTGQTRSPDFPLKRPLQSSNSGKSGFVTKLNANGTDLVFSTYIGGSNTDIPSSVALDGAGNILVAGSTFSVDFPGTTPLETDSTGEGFMLAYSSNGSSILFSTLIGGTGYDDITDLAVEADGSVYLSGRTSSADLPVLHPFQSQFRGGLHDHWYAKIQLTSFAPATDSARQP
jgi:hypothetical protein